ncbi:ethanolamine ammonia-lyase reactivating factor EutA [Propionispora hippei]|uniref:Ethanolamine utilization protein EutA n=1 Tax=Propionispora hippei DSM 15287 TaxID=1123003 RepID=A0A1M6EJU5_9FIRM|nr:ethanolamine ammonia-lyase reactivating factor EutA [Propionispora hippei]SHI85727.1 ethanolamine utilization protein EutA [Propionispora hippei DSM 15287]
MQDLISVGIDVGTTTTQLIFSRIRVQNTAAPWMIPELKITGKEVIYQSPVYFTPLLATDTIDAAGLQDMIAGEYKTAGFHKEEVSTGAVIITGETARKENAAEVALVLAEFAGDFVVATAGPDLEAVLAGCGAGAQEASKRLSGRVMNMDIGGGTSNGAVFWEGEVVDAFALDIGARLIRFDSEGRVTHIAERIKPLLAVLGVPLAFDRIPELAELRQVTDALADVFWRLQQQHPLPPETRELFIHHPHQGLAVEHMLFSGGVAEDIYDSQGPDRDKELFRFQDIGPLLGRSIRDKYWEKGTPLLEPKEKIRATVIGAGSHAFTISGSTVFLTEDLLPLKNVPIVRPFAGVEDLDGLGAAIAFQIRLYGDEQVAIAFSGPRSPSYRQIQAMAADIVEGMSLSTRPLVVIVEHDFAKALGQALRGLVQGTKKILCLDGIRVKGGDYVDIGNPVAQAVPVIVKTLIFS